MPSRYLSNVLFPTQIEKLITLIIYGISYISVIISTKRGLNEVAYFFLL